MAWRAMLILIVGFPGGTQTALWARRALREASEVVVTLGTQVIVLALVAVLSRKDMWINGH